MPIVVAFQLDANGVRADEQHDEALREAPQPADAEVVAHELQGRGARPQQHAIEVAGAQELGAQHVEAAAERMSAIANIMCTRP